MASHGPTVCHEPCNLCGTPPSRQASSCTHVAPSPHHTFICKLLPTPPLAVFFLFFVSINTTNNQSKESQVLFLTYFELLWDSPGWKLSSCSKFLSLIYESLVFCLALLMIICEGLCHLVGVSPTCISFCPLWYRPSVLLRIHISTDVFLIIVVL